MDKFSENISSIREFVILKRKKSGIDRLQMSRMISVKLQEVLGFELTDSYSEDLLLSMIIRYAHVLDVAIDIDLISKEA